MAVNTGSAMYGNHRYAKVKTVTGIPNPGPVIPNGLISQLNKPSSVNVRRMAKSFTRYPAQSGKVIATASRFLTQGLAIFAMNIPSGMAKTIHTTVTATAIASVLMEVDK
jgi:hypothetical protein